MHHYILRYLTLAAILLIAATGAQGQNYPTSETAPAGTVTAPLTLPPNLTVTGGLKNYIRTIVPRKAITSAPGLTKSTPPEDAAISIAFKDGFNRTMQVIQRNFTGSGSTNPHLVQPVDTRFQRGSYSFAAYPSNSSTLRTDGFNAQRVYYNGLYTAEGNNTAYSKSQTVSNATQRSSAGYAPGMSQVGQSRGDTSTFISNDATNVRRWSLDANGLPVSSGYYAANTLYGTISTDAAGSKVRVFKDKNDRVLQKIEWLSATDFLVTQYIYDLNGNLVYIIPPRAYKLNGSTATTIKATVLNNLCFQYRYDDKRRLIAQQQPGESGFTEIVYDRKDRVVMRRNALETQQGKWEVTFYDKNSRVIATSLYNNAQTRDYWQGQVDAIVPTTAFVSTSILSYMATYGGEGQYPGPITNNEVMSYSYYDHYNYSTATVPVLADAFNAASFPEAPVEADLPAAQSLRTQGMLIASRVKVIKGSGTGTELGDWIETVNYYDDKGRVIQQRTRNSTKSGTTPGKEINCNYYDFSNKVMLSSHYHENKKTGHAANEYTRYSYDDKSGRLYQTGHQVNEDSWKLLSSYSYDELGRVSRKVLGNYGEVQDYSYNIRGQLTAINGNYAQTGDKELESRSFGERLWYDYGYNKLRYDGKPAGMQWRGGGGATAPRMSYGYEYDLVGRLTKADFYRGSSGGWLKTTTDYTVGGISYDAGGNILTLNQRGMGLVGSSIVPVDMDQLTYTYEDTSNRLAKVYDAITTNYNIGDFQNSPANNTDYTYDQDGNTAQDLNKGISSVTYTWFNKPQTITFSNGNTIKYIYDAGGVKLQELVTIGGVAKRTDYVGNFVYQNDTLQYISTTEGRAVYSPTEGSYKEEFFVKDHLGNVRSVTEVQTLVTSAYLASYEVASAHLEGLVFDKVSEIAEDNPDSPDPGNLQSGLLNGSDPSKRVGTSLLLKVMAGDRVEMNVNSYYQGYNPGTDAPVNASTMLSAIVSTLTSGTGGLGGSESHNPQLVGSMFNSNNYTQFNSIVAAGNTISPSRPKASLNYILFNQQMQVVSIFCGAFQVNGNGTWGEIGTTEPLEIPDNGYLAVYLDNSSTHPVYFDQLLVRFTRGKQLEETHYYPHGLPMGNIGSSAMAFMPNRQKHQSNEYIKDAGLNWMDFNFRQYDPQIGRFLNIDPLATKGGQERHSPYAAMGNQPESMIDPNGLAPLSSVRTLKDPYRESFQFRNPLMAMMPTALEYMRKNFGQDGDFMQSMNTHAEDLREALIGAEIDELLGANGYTEIGEGSYVYNSMGGFDGGQGLGYSMENGQKIYDMPSTGIVTFDGVKYDLSSFEGFYEKYGNKFSAKSINGESTSEIENLAIDGKKTRAYSEAGTYLTLKNGVVSVGENADPKRKGTSFNYNRVFLENMFKSANSLSITLHTHPQPNAHVTYYKDNFPRGFTNSMGPSSHDYLESWSRSNMRNVIIDNTYIYLVGRERDQTIIFKR
ncbi:RHS repeat protein [Pedobacter panaciterrae]|uniref:RHS repeat protein n=1 Tax=Pedobacter panaciterrae TaxID=363849 RepID=UPI002597DB91|nr:RHS repeat-associated core domain-containing protein [uncultured Pedobacter sp.]